MREIKPDRMQTRFKMRQISIVSSRVREKDRETERGNAREREGEREREGRKVVSHGDTEGKTGT